MWKNGSGRSFPRVILAENDRLFEQEYQNLLSGLAERQIYELTVKRMTAIRKTVVSMGRKLKR